MKYNHEFKCKHENLKDHPTALVWMRRHHRDNLVLKLNICLIFVTIQCADQQVGQV